MCAVKMTRTKATARFSNFGEVTSEKPTYRAARKSVPPDVRSFWAAQYEARMSAPPSPTTAPKQSEVPAKHPPTQEMVDAAIKNLNERGGSSFLAIKKYITAEYKCDAQKRAPFIKKYLKAAVANGKLIQTTGTGAIGSFKIAGSVEKKEKGKKPAAAAKKTPSPKATAKAGDKKPNAKISDAAKKTARRG
ncbi:histone H1-like [Drosophila subobscura]|uniref:histone H1-like n=1 Tax=Drosophila subobscura TaxID=7241 RepID=UPI00155ADE37|nr:histone H1-like [Drosophila subobscura]